MASISHRQDHRWTGKCISNRVETHSTHGEERSGRQLKWEHLDQRRAGTNDNSLQRHPRRGGGLLRVTRHDISPEESQWWPQLRKGSANIQSQLWQKIHVVAFKCYATRENFHWERFKKFKIKKQNKTTKKKTVLYVWDLCWSRVYTTGTSPGLEHMEGGTPWRMVVDCEM